MSVVVRFAPSPTGPLHIGGIRTAFYNYLLAKKLGGKFILRIEDTDQVRFVPGAEEYIMEALRWCGIEIDYGVREGGPDAPYRQSERGVIYQQYTQQLLSEGKAYIAFDTPGELTEMRTQAEKSGNPGWQYNYLTRKGMINSLTLSEAAVKQRTESGEPYVIRLKVPEDQEVHFKDEIRGEVVVHTSQIDDKVLMKSDGMPTYHLANIIDDHLMKVTHVIRGEEWLPSAPLHLLLYQAFGWNPPSFAHLPLILRPDGNGKLSKRDGDRLGVPVFPLDWTDPDTGEKTNGFKESGYLPDALVNFMALLGWHPEGNEEVMSVERMIELFSIEKVGKSGTKFDIDKLHWFNQTYIKQKPNEYFLPYIKETLLKQGMNTDFTDEYLMKVAHLMKERAVLMKDFVLKATYLYQAPEYDSAFMAKQWNETGKNNLIALGNVWSRLNPEEWNTQRLHDTMHEWMTTNSIANKFLMPQLRLALTGVSGGPDSIEIADLLGKSETISRFERLIAQ